MESIDLKTITHTNKKHILRFEDGESESVAIKSRTKEKRLHIFKKIDTNTAIELKTFWYITQLVPNLMVTDNKHRNGQRFTQFRNTFFGQRPDIWIGHNWRVVTPTKTKQPTVILIGSCLKLQDGQFAVVTGVKESHLQYFPAMTLCLCFKF